MVDVLIMSMFTPSAASTSNIVAATPGLVRMPAPTIETRAMSGSAVTPLAPTDEEIAARYGRIADGELWRVASIRETGSEWARRVGSQTWELEVAPGRDLRLLWMHSFTLFGDSLPMTGERGAPLGLEVLILQKLLSTGLGGTILLLVCVAVTAAFVPTMVEASNTWSSFSAM